MQIKLFLKIAAILQIANCIGPTFSSAQHIIGGTDHALFLCSDSTVHAWGNDAYGELGNGSNTNSNIPVQVNSLTGIKAIASKGHHTLALQSDSTVWAWGSNLVGQLGNGTTTTPGINVPVLCSITSIVAIGAGEDHSLVVKSDGSVWAWGKNSGGQLGNATLTNSTLPVQVIGVTGIIAVAGGPSNSLGLKNDGTVWAWGIQGPLRGDSITVINNSVYVAPVQVHGAGNVGFLTNITAIAVGYHSCFALKNDGTVWAWGSNSSGELGNGENQYSTKWTPTQIATLSGIVAIAAGENNIIALKSDGTVWIWGLLWNNSSIELLPVQVSSLSAITEISAGYNNYYVLKNDGTIWTWGKGSNGQLGNGTSPLTISNTPGQANAPCLTTAINENTELSAVSIFPNPSNGVFQITSDESQITNLEIVNILGEKVYASTKAQVANSTIDISNQPKGVYFVKIYDGTTIYNQKIVVQ